MSHNTFGDIDTRPHREVYYPDPLDYSHPLDTDEEEGIDEFTHSQTDDPSEIFGEREPEDEYKYDKELGRVASSANSEDAPEGDEEPDEAA
jgi:hypothetical protein